MFCLHSIIYRVFKCFQACSWSGKMVVLYFTTPNTDLKLFAILPRCYGTGVDGALAV